MAMVSLCFMLSFYSESWTPHFPPSAFSSDEGIRVGIPGFRCRLVKPGPLGPKCDHGQICGPAVTFLCGDAHISSSFWRGVSSNI